MTQQPIHTEMKQISSRNISYQIELMEWSKKMDLIAVSSKGDVIIHRFKWQKVWSHPSPEENVKVRAIGWRNDEKVIAIGYSSGLVVLLDIENRDEIYSFNLGADITCMNWTNCSKSVIQVEEDASIDHAKFLATLPNLNSLSSTTKKHDYNKLRFYSKDKINLLITGLSSGKINLSIFGMLSCADIDLNTLFPTDTSITVKNSIMSSDLKRIFVVAQVNETFHLLTFENSLLSKYAVSLHNIAIQHGLVVNTISYINDTIQSITEAWESVLLEMDNKLTKFADSQPPGTLAADFLELLMFGYPPTTSLYQFLTKDLTEKGLKKLANSIELSYSTIQKLVVKPLTASVINVLYHLDTLKGMSKNKYFYAGLLNESIDAAVLSAGSLLVKTKELQQTIETSMRDYKIFFRWLYGIIVRLMDESVPDDVAAVRQQEVNYLADFLKNLDDINETVENECTTKRKFNLERVGQYLEDKNLIFPVTDSTSTYSWKKLLEENQCLKNSPNVFPHHKQYSLVQQFNYLNQCIKNAFKRPYDVLSEDYKMRNQIINTILPQEMVHVTSTYIEHENTAMFAVLENSHSLTLIETDQENQAKLIKIMFPNSSHLLFCHIQFYNEHILSMLLRNSNKSSRLSTYFLQFPIIKLRETAIPFKNGDQPRILNAFEVIDESTIKSIEGIDGNMIAVSGPRKVASILSENKKSIKIYECEIDEDDDETNETSSQNVSMEN